MAIAPVTKNYYSNETKPSLLKLAVGFLAIQSVAANRFFDETVVNPCSAIRAQYSIESPSITNVWKLIHPSTSFLAFEEFDIPCIDFEKENRMSEHEVVRLLRSHYSQKMINLLIEYKYFTPINVIPDFQNLTSGPWFSEEWIDFIDEYSKLCRSSKNPDPSCSRDFGCYKLTEGKVLAFCRNKFGCFAVGDFNRIKDLLCWSSWEPLKERDPFFSSLQKLAANAKGRIDLSDMESNIVYVSSSIAILLFIFAVMVDD